MEGNLSGETFFPSGFLKSADTEAIPLFPMPFASIMPLQHFRELSAG